MARFFAVFVVIAAFASAYLWLKYDRVQRVSSAAPPAAAPVVASGEEAVSRKDFEAFRLQIAKSLQSTIEGMDAQKEDLRKLSDQVTALAAKTDARPSAAQTTGSLSGELRPGTQQAVVPARPPIVAAKKKPPAPKTNGPISIGGAALPAPPATDR
jgi:hypothetical protein